MTDAIAEFRRADELALAYFKADKIAPEYDWPVSHNLDLLGTAYDTPAKCGPPKRFFDAPSTCRRSSGLRS